MSDGRIVFEIILAAFGVIGFYCVLKMIGERIFPTDCLDVAVRLCEEEQVDRLDLILSTAATRSRRRGRGVIVLISSSLMRGAMGYGEVLRPELEAMLRYYNADCFVVDIDRNKN